MKYLFTSLVMLACMALCFAEPENPAIESPSPEAIVDIQIEAYNQGDIDAFVATFARDVKTYAHPNTLQISGVEDLKKVYAGFFNANPELHAEVTGKIIQGNFVIYHEFVTGVAGGEDFFATAIYEVLDGKIQNIWFVQ
ncbi:nuclear transport factor 2 family protein [Gilvimarinus japonicus]|uniref:Nuclear transport factor 2 family protein n=1 Tax=Gilvimarinus japonicus TaxID=1796469 RepID=A0ABV7HQ67_9GAMM